MGMDKDFCGRAAALPQHRASITLWWCSSMCMHVRVWFGGGVCACVCFWQWVRVCAVAQSALIASCEAEAAALQFAARGRVGVVGLNGYVVGKGDNHR